MISETLDSSVLEKSVFSRRAKVPLSQVQWHSQSPCGGDLSPPMCRGRSMEVCIRVTTPKKDGGFIISHGSRYTVIDSAGEALRAAALGPI